MSSTGENSGLQGRFYLWLNLTSEDFKSRMDAPVMDVREHL